MTAPPLRERGDDILQLSNHFLKSFAQEELEQKKFSDAVIKILREYEWPGNIRELENNIRDALAFAVNDTIMPSDLSAVAQKVSRTINETTVDPATLSNYEEQAIRNALKQTAGNRRNAAKLLGISEATIYRRIKSYNIISSR